MKNIIYLSLILALQVIYSCQDSSTKKKEPVENKTTIIPNKKNEKRLDDSLSNQMMDFFGIKNKGGGFNELLKLDSIEKSTKEALTYEGFKSLLAKGRYTKKDIEDLVKMAQKKDSLDARLLIAKKKGVSKEEITAMVEEHRQFLMSISDNPKMVEEIYFLLGEQSISYQLETIGKIPLSKEKSFVRSRLQVQESSFIEEQLTTISVYNEPKRRKVLKTLKLTPKEKTDSILAKHFNITVEELQLAKTLPKSPKLLSKKEAVKRMEYQYTDEVKNYLKSGHASKGFKRLIQEFSEPRKRKASAFIKAAELAKANFFKDNPGWYNDDEAMGDTYRDSKYNYIYLPLGDLSFADKLISHYRGKRQTGSNSQGAIGIPDMSNQRFTSADIRICNLGYNGVLTLQFTNNTLTNINGPDLFVFEMGATEPTNLEISTDGIHWIDIGKIDGGTAFVDIEPFVKTGETFNYIRLTDLDYESTLPGADIDAVAAIGGAVRLNLDSEVLFDSGKFTLKTEGIEIVKKLAPQIIALNKGLISIEGHTDDVGSSSFNYSLSQKRAKSIANELKKIITSPNFTWKITGYGEDRPIVPNTSKENQKKNRRVEIIIIPIAN